MDTLTQSSISNQHAAAFCFAARALGVYAYDEPGSNSNYCSLLGHSHESMKEKWSCRQLNALKFHTAEPWGDMRVTIHTLGHRNVQDLHTRALKAIGILALALNSSLLRNQIEASWTAGRPFRALCSARNIPFLTFMDLPEPFMSTAPADLFCCHCPSMATKAFMEDSEWTGITHTDNPISYNHKAFAPFTFTAAHGDDESDILELESSTTTNKYDRLRLDFSVRKSDGVTVGRYRRERDGWVGIMYGILTPFGFVGCLSPFQYDYKVATWYWLWKQNWSGRS